MQVDDPREAHNRFVQRMIAALKTGTSDLESLVKHGNEVRQSLVNYMVKSQDQQTVQETMMLIGVLQSLINSIERMKDAQQTLIPKLEKALEQ